MKSCTAYCASKGGGFSAPVQLSTELANFMGTEMAPRTAVTKTIWVYIKANNLQNPADKREIICDAKMEQLFRKKRFNMFKMTKYLSEVPALKGSDVSTKLSG